MSSTEEYSRACSHPTLEPAEQPSETCKTPAQAGSCHEDHVGSNGSAEDLGQNHCRGQARLRNTAQTEGAAAAACHSRGDTGTEWEQQLQCCQHCWAGAGSQSPRAVAAGSPCAGSCSPQGTGSPHARSFMESLLCFLSLEKRKRRGKQQRHFPGPRDSSCPTPEWS